MVFLRLRSTTIDFREFSDNSQMPISALTSILDKENKYNLGSGIVFHTIVFLVSPKSSYDFDGQLNDTLGFLSRNLNELSSLYDEAEPFEKILEFFIDSELGEKNRTQIQTFPYELFKLSCELKLQLRIQFERPFEEEYV